MGRAGTYLGCFLLLDALIGGPFLRLRAPRGFALGNQPHSLHLGRPVWSASPALGPSPHSLPNTGQTCLAPCLAHNRHPKRICPVNRCSQPEANSSLNTEHKTLPSLPTQGYTKNYTDLGFPEILEDNVNYKGLYGYNTINFHVFV